MDEFDVISTRTGRTPLLAYSGPTTTMQGGQVLAAVAARGIAPASVLVEAQGNELHQQVARLGARLGPITGTLHLVTSPYQMEEALALFEALSSNSNSNTTTLSSNTTIAKHAILQCTRVVPVAEQSGSFSNLALAKSAELARTISCDRAALYRESGGGMARHVMGRYLVQVADGIHRPFLLPDLCLLHDEAGVELSTLADLAHNHAWCSLSVCMPLPA
jgi:hypothetical protein